MRRYHLFTILSENPVSKKDIKDFPLLSSSESSKSDDMMAAANRIFTVIEEQPVYLPEELSRKILLMLDGRSLHKARQVCQGWNEAVLNLVWGEDRVAVERKLENNWKLSQPLIIETRIFGRLVGLSGNRAVLLDTKDDECSVLAYNLQTQQISINEVIDDGIGHGVDDAPVFNETTKEIHLGRIKLKIMEDQVIKETVESYLPNIVALNSNLCIT